MTRDDADRTAETATRREAIALGGAAVGSGLLAGCISSSEPASDAGDGVTNGTTGEDATASDGSGEGDDAGGSEADGGDDESQSEDPYTVSLSPVGEVTFESPPETVFTRLTHHADMALALGKGDDLTAMHAPEYYDGLWNQFTERLPGVSVDWTGLYSSWKPAKETLYELDSDVHLADPVWIAEQDAWDRADVDEVAEQISPWFGNSLSDSHQEPPVDWAADYQYYGLWEQFEIVAEAFRERERYEELAAVHDDLRATIEDGLPDEADRPSAVMIAAMDLETIYSYPLSAPGFLTAHTSPFGLRDAFEGSVESGSTVDFEALLEADPDVILFLGGMEPDTDMTEAREFLRSDPVGGEITAIQDERVYAQGARYQGPILHLFQLEMTAKQCFPEQFGEWPTYTEGPYPDLPVDEQLFDRERVAAAIRGDL